MSKTDPMEEWKNAREATNKFDEILSDLRKYGFSIITGVITADAFIGFSEKVPIIIQISAIVVTMILVVILYWVDRYYDGLLWGAVIRLRFLEKFRLDQVNLSSYISGFLPDRILTFLHWMYVGFLIGALILGVSVTIVAKEPEDGTLLYKVLLPAFSAMAIIMYLTYKYSDKERKRRDCEVKLLIECCEQETRLKAGPERDNSIMKYEKMILEKLKELESERKQKQRETRS